MPRATSEPGDGQRTEHREDRESDDRIDADEACGRRTGKRTVRQRMRGERRPAQHDEEPDDAGDGGHDRRGLPGVEHETGKHQRACMATPTRGTVARRMRRTCESRYARKISVTTKKLTGHPLCDGNQ